MKSLKLKVGKKLSNSEKFVTGMKELFFIILANLCYVTALQFFFAGNNIAAGGFGGLATVLNHIIPITIGNFVFIMNIPFILISFKVFDFKYTAKILLSLSIYTLFANLARYAPLATTDKFAAAVFGGVLYGAGAIFMLQAKTSIGGTDLIARLLLQKFKNLSLGKMFMFVDGMIVLLSIFVYKNLEAGVYAITAIAVASIVMDKLISGFNSAYICYIITEDQPDEMADEIMREMKIGVTKQNSKGMYLKQNRYMLMVVVSPKQVNKLKEIALSHDPHAFMVIGWASEVLGGGFKTLKP